MLHLEQQYVMSVFIHNWDVCIFVCLFVCCLTAQRHTRVITVPNTLRRNFYLQTYCHIITCVPFNPWLGPNTLQCWKVHCLRWPPGLSGFSLSLSTSRSARGDTSAEAFITDGIALTSIPLLPVFASLPRRGAGQTLGRS